MHSPRPLSAAAFLIILGGLLGLQPLTVDFYIPALPSLRLHWEQEVSQLQLTLTGLLLAFGISQLFWGPASDRWGRRPVLLTGLALYVLTTAAAAWSPYWGVLVGARILQGVAMGACVMIARAMVRDLHTPQEGAQVFSRALTAMGVTACLSPSLGSWVTAWGGWQANLALQAGLGGLLLGWIWLRLPETLPTPHAAANTPSSSRWQASRHILENRTFWAYAATSACSFSGIFTFLSIGAFTFSDVHSWSTQQLGLLMGANGLCYITGTWLCRQCLPRWGMQRTMRFAAVVASATLLITLALHTLAELPDWALGGSIALYTLCHGIQHPCSQTGAVNPFPQAAGTAAALSGCIMMLAVFATGAWMGWRYDGSAAPLVQTLCFWACCVLGCVMLALPQGLHQRA